MNPNLEKNSAIHKVLDILWLFHGQHHVLSVEEISHLLDIPKSTAYRYVRILCDKEFLEKTGAAHYRLGLTMLELSRASNRDLRLIALPSMKKIAEAIGESVSLMRLFSRKAVCIESIEGRHALRVTIEHGRTQLLHAGASSKILLAGIPEDEWDNYLEFPLTAFTTTTITDKQALKQQINLIREQAYAISDGEIDEGARAIAIPIKNSLQETVAALSIEAPSCRMDDQTIDRYLPLLQQEAATIQRELGQGYNVV